MLGAMLSGPLRASRGGCSGRPSWAGPSAACSPGCSPARSAAWSARRSRTIRASASIRKALGTIGPGGSGPLTQIFISAIFSIVGVLAAACATQVVIRLRQEEASGSAEMLMSTPLSRVRWLLVVPRSSAVVAIVLVLAGGGSRIRAVGGVGGGGRERHQRLLRRGGGAAPGRARLPGRARRWCSCCCRAGRSRSPGRCSASAPSSASSAGSSACSKEVHDLSPFAHTPGGGRHPRLDRRVLDARDRGRRGGCWQRCWCDAGTSRSDERG